MGGRVDRFLIKSIDRHYLSPRHEIDFQRPIADFCFVVNQIQSIRRGGIIILCNIYYTRREIRIGNLQSIVVPIDLSSAILFQSFAQLSAQLLSDSMNKI